MTRRVIAVLALALIAFLGSGGVANASPAPTPQQTYAKCVAEAGIKALKEIDRQTWKSRALREAALKALIEKIKAACPKPGTGGTPTDVCPNIEGNQATIPSGYVKNASGNCVQQQQTATLKFLTGPLAPGETGPVIVGCASFGQGATLLSYSADEAGFTVTERSRDDTAASALLDVTNNTGQPSGGTLVTVTCRIDTVVAA